MCLNWRETWREGANLDTDTRWHYFIESGVGTADHDLHRIRRAAINPFFSQRSVRNLQPVIEERVDTLLARLHEHGKVSPDQPLDVLYPLSAFANGMLNSLEPIPSTIRDTSRVSMSLSLKTNMPYHTRRYQ